MSVRRLVRGTVPWEDLESVVQELAVRYDEPAFHVRFLEADNWLSTPCVVDDRWFVKIVSPQNALVHALFTTTRNIGVFSTGTEGFFEPFDGPVEMAAHELEATKRLREVGVNAPEPVESFEVDGYGVLVLEYLPDFTTLGQLDDDGVEAHAPALFDALSTMHEYDLAHGDLRGENVLVHHDELYFIDATNVSDERISGARAYDLASALASLEPRIGAPAAVAAAAEHYDVQSLLDALEFLDFVNMRPDHDFDAAALKGEIEKLASRG